MQYKSRIIFSELKTFFKNNDNSEAVLSVSRVLDDVHIKAGDLGFEKRHNCKLTALQTLQLLHKLFLSSLRSRVNHPG